MEMTLLGHASIRIRGRNATIITDPFDPKAVGLKFPSVTADIVTISHEHPDHNYRAGISGTPFILDRPGEYEIKGVRITSIQTYHDNDKGAKRGTNLVFHFTVDGIGILHCGDLGHKLSEQEIESFPTVDILVIPVGGFYTIDAKEAVGVVGQLEPKIVLPIHYNRPNLNQEVFASLQTVDVFLKELGKEVVQPQPKLSITKDKLPQELQIILLE